MTELLCKNDRISGPTVPEPKVVAVKLDLLSPGMEVGLRTTDPEGMAACSEGSLELNRIESFGAL